MTYGNLPYPDLPTLPIYLSQNPYERRPVHQNDEPIEENFLNQLPPPENRHGGEEEEPLSLRLAENKMDLTSTSSLPLLRMSNILFSYDDPERTAFFVPLMILLIVHALFLVYIHVYAPVPNQNGEEGVTGDNSMLWDYISLKGNKYYDVDGLKSKTA